MRVLLVAGGWSSEREVALSGARGIERALRELGHEVDWLDPSEDFNSLCRVAKDYDFAFLSLHGAPGEDGLIQAMLDAVGCPFQGAGPAGSFLALNKASSKQLFRMHGLLTADWEFVPCPASEFHEYETGLPFPVFAKSNTGGSSLDMGRADDARELNQVLAGIFAKGHDALIEPVIKGVELTCAVLDDEPLPPIQITAKAGDFFDYTSKYEQGGAEEICPAPVSPEITARLQEYALAAHGILGLEGYSRADFIRRDDDLFLLEVNTLPGMTPTSLLPQAAQEAGYDFPALLARLMELGIKRQQKRRAQEPDS